MVAQKTNIQSIRPIEENKAKIEIASALKDSVTEFADAQTTVNMGPAKGFAQVT